MIRTTLLALLLAALTFAADPPTKAAVETAEKAWGAAMAKNDGAALTALLADDLTYTHSTGAIDTKSSLIGKMKSGEQKYLMLNHEGIDTRLYGSTAVINATAKVQTAAKGVPGTQNHLRFIHVWVHQQGAWKLVAHQSLRIP
jgi:ketosteroid isomerase-like protein